MKYAIVALLLLWVLAPAGQGLAWGIKKEMGEERARVASLAYKASRTGHVSYCLHPFDAGLVHLQREEIERELKALSHWLEAYNSFTVSPATMDKVDSEGHCDLQVWIAPSFPNDHSNGAYMQHIAMREAGQDFMLLKINSDWVWHETRSLPHNANGDYRWQDMSFLLKDGQDFSALAVRWVQDKRSLDDLAVETGHAHSELFHTTYRLFLHEIGHAFGLCDTEPALFTQQCGEASQGLQPQSLMLYSNFLYLTEDDRKGLEALAKYVDAE